MSRLTLTALDSASCLLRMAFLFSLLMLSTTASGQETNEDTRTQDFFVFLTTGKSTADVEKAEIEKKQQAHLDNFKKLFEQKKLFAAGPLADPERKLRGIVGLRAADRKQLDEMFQADPYVTEGFLKVEAYPVAGQLGEFRREFSTTEMEEFQLVVVRANPDAPQESGEMAAATHQYLTSIMTADKLRSALRFADNDEKVVGVLVLKKQAAGETEKMLDQFGMIKAGHWKATILPLYMSQGILD